MNLQQTNSDLELLRELVDTDSQSRFQQGVRHVQYLLKDFLDQLGFHVELVSQSEGAPLFIGNIGDRGPVVTLISHADTVIPASKSHFRIDGTRAYGAGIADNKAGVVVALKAVKIYLENCGTNRLRLQFVNSPTEEIGSPGLHESFKLLGLNSQYAFGFEPSLEDGGLIKSRNGNKWIKITVQGKSFHAGRAHKGHINAAQDLCQVLVAMNARLIDNPLVTFNIGELTAGHSYNTIAETAVAKIDTRFQCLEGLKHIQEMLEEDLQSHFHPCSNTAAKSRYQIDIEDFCPPMKTKDNNEMINNYIKHIEKLENGAPKLYHCGGAADVNHFYHEDLIALDGCGAVGGNLHRVDEYIEINSLNSRAQAFANFLLDLNKRERYGYH